MKFLLLFLTVIVSFFSSSSMKNVSPFLPNVVIYQSLSKEFPPAELTHYVHKALSQGVQPNAIIIAFDFDGTLSTKKYVVDSEGNPIKGVPTPGQLRGGERMKGILEGLNKQGIHLSIVTAGGSNGMVSLQGNLKPYQIDSIFNLRKEYKNARELEQEIVGTTESGNPIYISGNIMSGKDGYDKPEFLDKYMTSRRIFPKLIIFVDDGAINVMHMATELAMRYPKAKFIGLHVPQADNPYHKKLIQAIQNGDPNLAQGIFGLEPGEIDAALEIKKIARQSRPIPPRKPSRRYY